MKKEKENVFTEKEEEEEETRASARSHIYNKYTRVSPRPSRIYRRKMPQASSTYEERVSTDNSNIYLVLILS